MIRFSPVLFVALVALAPGCRRHRAAPARRAPPRVEAAVDLRRDVDTLALEQYARTQRFTQGRPSRFKITPRGEAVLFLRTPMNGTSRALYVWDRASGLERVLATAQQLLQQGDEVLSPEERARRERQRISGRGLSTFELSPDGARVLVPLSGRLFVIERLGGAVTELPSAGGPAVDARFSPDGRSVSLVRGGELAVIDLATRAERRLTQGATENLTHATAEFIAQEELDRMEGYWWSPDASKLVYQETDLSRVERLRLSDPAHPERAPETPAYPRVGTANADVKLGVMPAGGGATTWLQWDRARYPYVATVRWSRNAPLTVVVMNRAQTDVSVLRANDDGTTAEIHHEHDDAWVNIDQDFPRWMPDGRSFLWATEQSGQWQIEQRDLEGEPLGTLTAPELNVRGLVQYDDAHRALYVLGGDDPTQTRLARVTVSDDPQSEVLTPEPGEHEAVVADDGSLQVRVHHTLTALPTFTVHDASGARVGAITSTTEPMLRAPRVEVTTVGAEGFHAAVIRPRGYVATRRYPVLMWVYGGPHSRLVVQAAQRYVVQQWLADQGFVVVMADGRGTEGRGRAWERALHLRLGDAPVDDQITALRALAARDPSLDLTRVGVIGWSFGGYVAARAVIEHPESFHAAVAGAPVTEWREYDTCYTERYLGLADAHADAYERASLLPHAPTLSRPLLVVHGTADDNVYFHNSLRLIDALYRAGRRVEFLPLPGQTHLVNDGDLVVAWLLRARAFFVEHLHAEAPIAAPRRAIP